MSGRAAFGSFKNNMYQSELINKKKDNAVQCPCRCPNRCRLRAFPNNRYQSYNKYNVVAGQYYELDLKDVTTVNNITSTPVVINPNETLTPFYYTNTIDPYGQLFGNTECGIFNYTNYIKLYANLPNNLLNKFT